MAKMRKTLLKLLTRSRRFWICIGLIFGGISTGLVVCFREWAWVLGAVLNFGMAAIWWRTVQDPTPEEHDLSAAKKATERYKKAQAALNEIIGGIDLEIQHAEIVGSALTLEFDPRQYEEQVFILSGSPVGGNPGFICTLTALALLMAQAPPEVRQNYRQMLGSILAQVERPDFSELLVERHNEHRIEND